MGLPLPLPAEQTRLVEAALEGDRTAADDLSRAVWPMVRRIALAVTGNPALADDAAQDAMLRILGALPRFDLSRPLGPWVRTIARNVARNTRDRTEAPVEAVTPEAPPAPDLERRMDLDAAARSALAAFASLTPRQREIVELCDHQGLTPTEAATELGIAPGTARATLHAARTELRRRLLADRPDLLDSLRDA